MTELTALTPDELDMVSGGASASAATAFGTDTATAGAADTLFANAEIEVPGGEVEGPAFSAAIAGGRN